MLLSMILDYQYLSSGKRNYAHDRPCSDNRHGGPSSSVGRATCSLFNKSLIQVCALPALCAGFVLLSRMASSSNHESIILYIDDVDAENIPRHVCINGCVEKRKNLEVQSKHVATTIPIVPDNQNVADICDDRHRRSILSSNTIAVVDSRNNVRAIRDNRQLKFRLLLTCVPSLNR